MEIDERHFTFLTKANNFPIKLWHLVNSPQISSICWDISEEGILIYQELFIAEVLFSPNGQMSEYFRTTDFTSFVRQLNLYGFRKVRSDRGMSEQQLNRAFTKAQVHHFQNPNFKRANPEHLVNLKRLTSANKAKHTGGAASSSQSSRHFYYPLLNSPQENPAVLKNDPVLVNHEGTPYHHQHGKNYHRTPKPPQAYLMGYSDPGSMLHHFPLDSPCAHSSSSMPMQQGFQSAVPPGSLVYQSCSPGFFNTNMPYSQEPAASYTACAYYPEYPVSFIQCMDQNSQCQAVGDQDPRDMGMNLHTISQLAEEMQAAASSNLPNDENSPV